MTLSPCDSATQIGEVHLDLEELGPSRSHQINLSRENVHELSLQPSTPSRVINFEVVSQELSEYKAASQDRFP
jgi:hypothetical protein